MLEKATPLLSVKSQKRDPIQQHIYSSPLLGSVPHPTLESATAVTLLTYQQGQIVAGCGRCLHYATSSILANQQA